MIPSHSPAHHLPLGPVMADVAGLVLTEAERARLLHPGVGGVILFKRNYESPAQIAALCREIHALRSPHLLIGVDHEGGRVQRFREGFTPIPPMRAIGEVWDGHPQRARRLARDAGYVIGAELRAAGVDFSFAPVLDLDYPEDSDCDDRAFHRSPQAVTDLAHALVLGLQEAGVAHCGKHFPGHGFVRADSHVAVPVDRRSLKTILADDARPYEWLSATLTAVMPAHVVYPRVDRRPAGFSPKWLGEILRGRLGFTGLIFSDDLSMEGARRVPGVKGGAVLSYAEAATLALEAGCDMVLLCNQSLPTSEGAGSAIDTLIDGLAEAQLKGHWQPREASEQRRLALLPQTPALDWDSLMVHGPYMQALDWLP